MRTLLPLIALATFTAPAAADWVFAPSHFTHDPRTGTRVAQYALPEPVEPLPDPRNTVSRYWTTRTQLRGIDGSLDTIYDVRSFGNAQGGFDAQRERGFDASLQTLDALRPFRFNPYLFFGGLQGFGYGFPGYSAPTPGTSPYPTQQSIGAGGFSVPPQGVVPGPVRPADVVPHASVAPQTVEGCTCTQCAHYRDAATAPNPAVGQPGSAYPYAPPQSIVAPLPYPFIGGLPFGGFPPYRVPYGSPGYGHPPMMRR